MDLYHVIRSMGGYRRDDDFTDRINHIFTSLLLVLFAVVVTTRQYVGEPIDCWCPSHFPGNYIRYANNICWVKNTYYVPMDQELPENNDPNEKPQLRYYQWLPFILLSFALLYQIPCLFWRGNNETSGLNLENIISISGMYVDAETMQAKDNCIKMLTKHFDRYLEVRKRCKRPITIGVDFLKEVFRITCVCTGRKYGNFLTLLYVTTKFMYLINAIIQFILTDIILSNGQIDFYGIQLFRHFVAGTGFMESRYFPRVTICDFHIREIGYEVIGHRYTVQCVLPVNLFSEAIFGFYWFWLVMVIVFNAFSLLKWIWYSLIKEDNIAYVKKHIRKELVGEADLYSSLREFVIYYLRSDGVFVMRMISHNSTDIVVTDLVSAMYENFKIRRVEISENGIGLNTRF